MRIYRFEDVDAEWTLLPLAARRALDCAGQKLSLKAWQRLERSVRVELAELGSAEAVEGERVRQLLRPADPAAIEIECVPEPSAAAVPEIVAVTFAKYGRIPAGTWAALSAIERYVLLKVTHKPRATRLAAAFGEIIGDSALSSHLEAGGGVRMVNVAAKPTSERQAQAEARLQLSAEAFGALSSGTAAKGDVLAVARVAAIMAAKRTPDLIPLCHSVALTQVRVEFELVTAECAVWVRVSADAVDRTGVEMEALTAASVAALTIYDMLKGIDRGIEIGPLRVNRKRGGRTGDYER